MAGEKQDTKSESNFAGRVRTTLQSRFKDSAESSETDKR